MKKKVNVALFLFLFGLLASPLAVAGEMSNAELLREIKAMKARIEMLEAQLAAPPATREISPTQSAGDVGLADRVRRIEEKIEDVPVFGKWTDNITLSGAVEVEAGFEKIDFDAPGAEDEESSDIALATVELGIDADIAKHVSGHVLLLWEEDDTEPVDLDEAFITLDGEDVIPLYLVAGKMYVPFGKFESHMISDPITKDIGETRESAINVGFANDMAGVSLAVFNGDIDEAGDDDHVDAFVACATVTVPENTIPEVGLTMGISYISNIADSDGLEGEIASGELNDSVAGLGAFLSLSFRERFFLEAEYVGALDEFEAGELSFDGGNELQPVTWNLEFAVAATDLLEMAFRCEGGDDLADFLPEIQYGATLAYSLFPHTTLALEFLHGEFENDDERDLLTTQLAVEF